MKYYIRVITKNYVNFKGRASRKEFWMFRLCNALIEVFYIAFVTILCIWFDDMQANLAGLFFSIIIVYEMFILIPSLALNIRRLHDVNKSWAWFLIWFVPFANIIWYFVYTCTRGDMEPNRFGEKPD